MSITQFIRERKLFILTYLIGALAALIAILVTDKLELHLSINQHLPETTDLIAKYLTYAGDGRVAPFLLLPLLFVDWRKFLLAVGMMAIVGLIVAGLKHVVFDDVLRPILRYEEGTLRIVEGVKMHMSYSFPSGHSACVMSLVIGFLLWVRKSWAQLLGTLLVLGGAFSRVYLSQHFMEDILAGTFLSLLLSILMIAIALKLNWLRYREA